MQSGVRRIPCRFSVRQPSAGNPSTNVFIRGHLPFKQCSCTQTIDKVDCRSGGSLPLAAAVPVIEGLHGGFVPGSVRGVGGAAVAVGADFPPVDAGEPGLVVEGGEERVVTFGLDFEIDWA